MDSKDPPNVLELDPAFATCNDLESDGSNNASRWESDTFSLISTAWNYTFENGRRYHGYKQGKYMVPNDEAEQDRMDLFHHCILLALRGKLFGAPVGAEWKPQRILDIGTGSGIWVVDIADQYPDTEIIGVDLSPIQPTWVPPNVKFEVDDIEEDWEYEDSSFDFIHIRHMAGHINDWQKLYRQAFKALKPGGWIEVQDVGDYFCTDDNSIPDTSSFLKYVETFANVCDLSDKQFSTVAPDAAKSLQDVGCVDIGEKLIKLPIGRWPKGKHEKELGMYWRQNCLDGIEAYALAPFTRILGWSKKTVDEFLVDVSADLANLKIHSYSKFYSMYGRKPQA